MTSDKRLIEDYLPIEAISAEASREKSVRKGHISTLHLWWARRPLVACRAAVYGALVPASQFVPQNGPDNKKQSLGRANAAKFVTELCKYPGNPRFIAEAQRHILEAHAERLTAELESAKAGGEKPAWVEEFKFTGERVTAEDIEAGRAPRPRVLDMFAGGGAIPLEALRLGCEAYALDLNPVAHIIELCTLVYPQKYGKADPNTRGMTGPKGPDDYPTWGGLANEVRYWGERVLEKVKKEIGDLYPPIPDPKAAPEEIGSHPQEVMKFAKDPQKRLTVPKGYLTPVAYLWTRTVTCKNPACKATVPLVKQTWLCKKKDRSVAMKMVPDRKTKRVRFEVVESKTEKALGFNPEAGSSGGNATCPFCGTVADSTYVKAEGCAGRINRQMMIVVCTRPDKSGKTYLNVDDEKRLIARDEEIEARIQALCKRTGLTAPNEGIEARMTGGICLPYGLTDFGKLFTPRQMLCLLTFAAAIREAEKEMHRVGISSDEVVKGLCSYLGILGDRQADYNSSLARWHNTGEKISATFGRQALPMVWDFAELAPFGGASGSSTGALDWITGVIESESDSGSPAQVQRGSATALPWAAEILDAVITDPPYYDNVDYAKISDFFYVWLRRSVGHLYPEHFASDATPKKAEAVADPVRYGGSRQKARTAYEDMMARSFAEANRVLKSSGQMVVVYAHKTTLGWATLVDALRQTGFVVTEAWPFDTEMKARLLAMDTAALASSIFLVARKRPDYSEQSSRLSAEEKAHLVDFMYVCDAIKERRFVKDFDKQNHTIRSWQNPDGSLDGYTPQYDEDDLRALMTDFRKLVAKKERTNIYKILAILDKAADGADREELRKAREGLLLAEKGPFVLDVTMKDGTKRRFTPKELVDVYFNGEVFHLDIDKHECSERMKDFGIFRQSCMLSYLSHVIRQALNLSQVTRFRGYHKTHPELGKFEDEVRPELERIVRERVATLWDMGVSGADLVIACVGAGLRAFTRYARVEYANGEEVPAARFLSEVEAVVLESILGRLSKEVGANGGRYGLAGIDPSTRFYVIWRYTYRSAELDAGEAIVFANGTHVELEGPSSITYGARALAEKKKSKYRLRDYSERGEDEKLGMPREDGTPAPLIDALHKTLWLMENRPRALAEFLRDSGVNREQMRLVAQALAGPALKGGELKDVSPTGELAALSKIMANWRSVVEDATMTVTQKEDRGKKQARFDFGKER